MIKFTVSGEPKGKGRPRFTKAGGFARTYTPKDTADYESLVRLEYCRQCGNAKFDKGEMLDLHISAYYAIPKSAGKKKKQLMACGKIRPTKKPDMDNIIKIIADSLNGIAYYDDAQIVQVSADKFYSDVPRVEVEVSEIEYDNGRSEEMA